MVILMKTILINALAGPCGGKTTSCWEIAAALKRRGIIVEYVSEYTKELVYDKNWVLLDGSLEHQQEILKEQKKRQDRLYGQVQVIVTDAPLLFNIIYLEDRPKWYVEKVLDIYNSYNSLNIFIKRDKNKFTHIGRNHNLEESIEKDKEILDFLERNDIPYIVYDVNDLENFVDEIIKSLE